MNKKVIIAMSGGVDSSVAAALLKKAGFDVIGVFMKFWHPESKNRCCSAESEKRARSVAKKINIPFYIFNFEKDFKKKIVDSFLKINKEGRTPNPCVVCNKEIKFGLLLEKALKLGAEYIATGHYARKSDCKLLKGKDKNKDQSYFLWKLNQKQLERVLFPVGSYTKPEVRVLARKFNLSVAETPESQEICFVQTTVNEFLRKYIKTKPGKIVDINGKIIGEHQGLWFYTIGQRKGLKISSDKPYYVLNKNIKNNTLIVTQEEKDLLGKELTITGVNWISGKEPKFPISVIAKVRYRNKGTGAVVKKEKGKIKVIFKKSQRAITPGQSAVFYKGQELLGGGIIE